jgi:phospholipid/cholesterol/gamma-HCH transport system ATP-binding protein
MNTDVTTSAIEVRDFSAAYGEHIVLHDVNFTVARGEILFIAGGSGSGKSTILKHLIGLQMPAKGTIQIDGDNLFSATGADRDRILRKFGVSFQSGALFGSMTVLENVKLPLEEFAGISGARADVIALTYLQLVGLADSAHELPSELSGGMQKRAAIARALVLAPMIVFMDEPSAGLDPITSAELDELIRSLNHLLSTTFVIVSHELASIFGIADRVLLFSGEKHTLVAEGKPRELAQSSTDPWVHAFFNREAPKPSTKQEHV